MKASPRGFWLAEGGHIFDVSLASGISKVLTDAGIETVLDIGCGNGAYVQYLEGFGFDVEGYDGNPLTEQITGGRCHERDFSEPQHLGMRDAVLSLEVGEHIPEDYEDIYIENLDRHASRMIILSWAIPEQGGFGHVNERDNAHVIAEMASCDWLIDRERTDFLRSKASNARWFANTVMVFTK